MCDVCPVFRGNPKHTDILLHFPDISPSYPESLQDHSRDSPTVFDCSLCPVSNRFPFYYFCSLTVSSAVSILSQRGPENRSQLKLQPQTKTHKYPQKADAFSLLQMQFVRAVSIMFRSKASVAHVTLC